MQTSIRKKYIRALILLLIPFLIFTGFITANLWYRIQIQGDILDRNLAIVKSAEQALTAVRDANNYLLKTMMISDPRDLKLIKEYQDLSQRSIQTSNVFVDAIKMGSDSEEFKTSDEGKSYSHWVKQGWSKKYKVQEVSPEIREISGQASEHLGEFSQHANKALTEIDRVFKLLKEKQTQEAKRAREDAIKEIMAAGQSQQLASNQLDSLIALAESFTHSSRMKIKTLQLESLVLIAGNALVLFIMVNILSLYFIKRKLVNPLIRLERHVSRLGQGELGAVVPVETDDEIGQVAKQFNAMSENLEQAVVSKDYVDNIINSIPESLIVLDDKGHVKSTNPATLAMLGYTAEEIISLSFNKIFYVKSGDNLLDFLENRTDQHLEETYLTKKGDEIPVIFSCSVIEGKYKMYLCAAQDLREHKQVELEKQDAQRQLQEAQKMESIGQLAGGIAHDFNNLLGGILGYAQLIKTKVKLSQEESSYIINIIKLSKRAAELTGQLLAFARKGQFEQTSVNLNDIVNEACDIFSRTLEPSTVIHKKLFEKLWTVKGDSSQILQVLMNLGLNAHDAMPKGGNLTFTTENFEVDVTQGNNISQDLKPGKYVKLTVKDTGVGIPENVLNKVFEPFFTTKPLGKGTGLGLSMVYGIMQQHEGKIVAESKEGVGSKFHLLFPALTEKLKKEETKIPLEKLVDRIEKTILVVDDKGYMREMVAKILQDKGAQLLFASNGQEAVNIYRNAHKKIDCIMMDVVMPKMDGIRAYQEVQKINPDVKVLFFSGYSESSEINKLCENDNVDFIQKPFDTDLLFNKLIKMCM